MMGLRVQLGIFVALEFALVPPIPVIHQDNVRIMEFAMLSLGLVLLSTKLRILHAI